MFGFPTTTVTVLRKTGDAEYNEYEDDYDTVETISEETPASILEQNSIVSNQGEVVPRDITTAVGRVAAGTDVRKGDELLDERTGKRWFVDEVATNQNVFIKVDSRLALRRVN